MALFLDSCAAKIERAAEHMDAVQKQIDTWRDSGPYGTTNHRNPELTRHSTMLVVNTAPDLEGWALIAGDAFHNLRSALDHFVSAIGAYEIAAADLTPKIQKALSFPICDTPNDFKSKFWHIKPLSADVRAEIERLQPYNRPHPKVPPLLAVLRDFDDIDKHRALQLAVTVSLDAKFTNIRGANPPGVKPTPFLNSGPLDNGAEIAALITPVPSPQMHYEFLGNYGVALPHVTGPNNLQWSGIGYLFEALGDEVNEVIKLVSAKVI